MNNIAEILHGDGVVLKLGTAVNEIHSGQLLLSDGSTVKTDCVIWSAGLKGAAVASGLELPQGRGGQINVQHDLSVKDFPGVYALGEFANIAGTDGNALPQLGSVAQQSGRWAAKNILAEIEGQPLTAFRYHDEGITAMIGKNAAIAEITTSWRGWWPTVCGSDLSGIKAINSSYEKVGGPSVTLDDIKTFRQVGSRCLGHPEYSWTSGVETTTGPLGQGVATSMGMAIAERFLAQTYNRPGFDVFDFNVDTLCGDGDMMEGLSSEAASIAGHLRLSNLRWIYNSNRLTIEGYTDIAVTEDVAARFLGYDWEVIRVTDPNDIALVERALADFEATDSRPTLIIVHSHIGYGSLHKQNSPTAHGEPLGPEEVRLTKEFFGFSPDQNFVVPPGVMEQFSANLGARGARLRKEWEQAFTKYGAQYPDLADQIKCIAARELPAGWDKALPAFPPSESAMATRDASGKILNALAEKIPWLIGGAASDQYHVRLAVGRVRPSQRAGLGRLSAMPGATE
jgi:transketolase N-terminal domain/subunit